MSGSNGAHSDDESVVFNPDDFNSELGDEVTAKSTINEARQKAREEASRLMGNMKVGTTAVRKSAASVKSNAVDARKAAQLQANELMGNMKSVAREEITANSAKVSGRISSNITDARSKVRQESNNLMGGMKATGNEVSAAYDTYTAQVEDTQRKAIEETNDLIHVAREEITANSAKVSGRVSSNITDTRSKVRQESNNLMGGMKATGNEVSATYDTYTAQVEDTRRKVTEETNDLIHVGDEFMTSSANSVTEIASKQARDANSVASEFNSKVSSEMSGLERKAENLLTDASTAIIGNMSSHLSDVKSVFKDTKKVARQEIDDAKSDTVKAFNNARNDTYSHIDELKGKASQGRDRIEDEFKAYAGSELSRVTAFAEDLTGEKVSKLSKKDLKKVALSTLKTELSSLASVAKSAIMPSGFNYRQLDTEEELSAVELARLDKNKSRLREGRFKVGVDTFESCPYVFVPSSYLQSPTFNLADIFDTIDIPLPSILFRFFQTDDPVNWNVKLPQSQLGLQDIAKVQTNNPKNKKIFGPLSHYQKVLKENCRRMLSAVAESCTEAGAAFRINESWSSDAPIDAVASWVSNNNRSRVNILGIASSNDYHPDIWKQLDAGASADFDELAEGGNADISEVLIDPQPFYDGTIKVTRHPTTQRVVGSFPHPNLTHLIISDNRPLLEQKIAEALPWGLIMINGSRAAADLFVEAIQDGLPVIAFKYTGYTADIACEMLERAEKYLDEKSYNSSTKPERPFRNDMPVGYKPPNWLRPFDESYISDCEKANILIDNLPDRFDSGQFFIVDMFSTTDDELQDRLTQTMAVAFEGDKELGGSAAEHKRLTYAWRTRHLMIYNAMIFKRYSDVLHALMITFTMLSTFSAVLHTYAETTPELFGSYQDFALGILLKGNLLLPLITTVIRGVISILNPQMKYISLIGAAIFIESEIYCYRAKVGKYNPRLVAAQGEGEVSARGNNVDARVIFSSILDAIWQDLSASDVQNTSLKTPSAESAVDDVNQKLRQNRQEQELFTTVLEQYAPRKERKKERAKHIDTGALKKTLDSGATSLRRMSTLSGDIAPPLPTRVASVVPEETSDFPVTRSSILRDDGLKALSADEYVNLRLIPELASLTGKASTLASSTYFVTISVIVLSVSASALSTFGYSLFIPAVLSLSGAITAWGSYMQTDLRLVKVNGALAQLNQLIIWWDGLTMIEKRVPSNKEILIRTCEAAIQAQAAPVGAKSNSGNTKQGTEGTDGDGESQGDKAMKTRM